MTQRIHDTALLGVKLRMLQGMVGTSAEADSREVILPEEIFIGPYCVIGAGARLGNGVIIDSYCKVDPGAEIGEDSLLVYRATVGSGAKIGRSCVAGGNVSEGVTIGDRTRTFGKLIHSHADSTQSWDHRELPEPAPTIGSDSFVAHGSIVIGGVTVGPRSYVCAGTIVTQDVPEEHIAYGVNKIIHYTQWQGDLRNNPLFRGQIVR